MGGLLFPPTLQASIPPTPPPDEHSSERRPMSSARSQVAGVALGSPRTQTFAPAAERTLHTESDIQDARPWPLSWCCNCATAASPVPPNPLLWDAVPRQVSEAESDPGSCPLITPLSSRRLGAISFPSIPPSQVLGSEPQSTPLSW